MRPLVIFPSVRASENFGKYFQNFAKYGHSPAVMVIDETAHHRDSIIDQFTFAYAKNEHCTPSLEFYGVEERKNFFQWLTKKHKELVHSELLIPEHSHDELSFGLLVAATRNYDMIVFLDDDTYPLDEDFLGQHRRSLNLVSAEARSHQGSWVNTHPVYFVRGFPYSERSEPFTVEHAIDPTSSVLHMGCWSGIPDLNAYDYIVFQPKAEDQCAPHNYRLAKGQFAPICSMNLAFRPEIIPAFYQLWDNNRYNDIFSGIFLKHIADHLGKSVSVGGPLCYHEKAPRDYFKDAAIELASIKLNEVLWRIISQIPLKSDTWLSCYRELAKALNVRFHESEFGDIIELMTSQMMLWCETVEALMPNA